MATFTEREAKPSVLIVRKLIDGWFWEKYGINPYNGCQFGCVYCDSRSQKYFLPFDFENDIVVKTNIGPVLDRRLTNARKLLPDIVGLGGTTDPYQPAEAVYHNSRSCLEVLAKHRYPAHVITKSRLVLEDMDLLERIGQDTWCAVS
jgi:DNA repair photolyase